MFMEIQGLKKSFGSGSNKVTVLKGIDFSLERGEFCVLLDHPVPVNQLC